MRNHPPTSIRRSSDCPAVPTWVKVVKMVYGTVPIGRLAMATIDDSYVQLHNPGVVRFALTGALVAAVFYISCWVGAQLPIGPATHMYLRLFTNAGLSSVTALIEGVCWSLSFGLIAGALIAVIYNALAFLDRR